MGSIAESHRRLGGLQSLCRQVLPEGWGRDGETGGEM